jgi:hypothetical protein|tara:strand:+ start:2101 stop:2286 length:186 start_codon:yes stop_codon:yes gene_type:complete
MSEKFDPVAYAESKGVELSEADLKKIAGWTEKGPIDRMCLCRPAKAAAPKKKAAKKEEAGE